MALSPAIEKIHQQHVEKKFKDLMFETALLNDQLQEVDVQHTFGFNNDPETVSIEEYPMKAEDINALSLEEKEEYLLNLAKEIDEFIEAVRETYDENYFGDYLQDDWDNQPNTWEHFLGTCNAISEDAQNLLIKKLKEQSITLSEMKGTISNYAEVLFSSYSNYLSNSGNYAFLADQNVEEDETALPDELRDKLRILGEEDFEFISKNVKEGQLPDWDTFKRLHYDSNVSFTVGIIAWLVIEAVKLSQILNEAIGGKENPGAETEIEITNPFEGDEMFQEWIDLKYDQEEELDIPSSVQHYLDSNGLSGILRSFSTEDGKHTIWLFELKSGSLDPNSYGQFEDETEYSIEPNEGNLKDAIDSFVNSWNEEEEDNEPFEGDPFEGDEMFKG